MQQIHLYFFSKMWSCSLWDWMSQSATWVTSSLSEDLQNDCLTDLSIETIKFDKELLKRDDLVRVSKHWRAWNWWS